MKKRSRKTPVYEIRKRLRWLRRGWYRLYLKRVRMVEEEIGEELAVC